MSDKNNDFKDIENKIKKLPKIEDNTPKEVLFQKIQNKMDQSEKPKRSSKRWIIPTMATVASLFIILLIAQSIPWNHVADQQESSMDRNEATTEESTEDSEISDSAIVPNEQKEQETQIMEDESKDEENNDLSESQSFENEITNEEEFVYHVGYEKNENLFDVHTAVTTNEAQYAIPITLIDTSGGTDVNYYYNALENFIDPEEYGIELSLLEGLEFNIDALSTTGFIDVSSNFSSASSGTMGNMLEQILGHMLVPYGFESIPFEGSTNNLGQLAGQNPLPLSVEEEVPYKYYQAGEEYSSLLVPITNANIANIEETLEYMKEDEEPFNVFKSIPNDASITTNEISNTTIEIAVESEHIAENQTTLKMVEAILMTAKSFGYQEVIFDIGINEVGTYDLTTEIKVPLQINPKLLH
ncbi:hypothetical protein [Saliterribacillus persicus]|uniref:Sporulation and spore germination protein n=1 Tax=Saliterribacillus persicus TaxID=930114 RepID=A0A368XAA3_9BACI|nr:hypothetical protein [Saliterribacillus persicus]RCW64880.1 hypothetical protein DFR57_11258 [Saliterribacillus persicus]